MDYKPMKILLRASVVAVSVLISSVAFAQDSDQGAVAKACADDIAKMCADKEQGSGQVRACVAANKDKVSAACKTALDTTGLRRRQ